MTLRTLGVEPEGTAVPDWLANRFRRIGPNSGSSIAFWKTIPQNTSVLLSFRHGRVLGINAGCRIALMCIAVRGYSWGKKNWIGGERLCELELGKR